MRRLIAVILCLGISFFGKPSYAQELSEGVFKYLRSEPMTLFDAGMKSLRKQAIEVAAYFSAKPTLDATALVAYRSTEKQIEIVLGIETEAEVYHKNCVDLRKQAILKMLRIGRSTVSSQMTMKERIERRLGGQFAHEPNDSTHEFVTLGSRLGERTYFSVKLSDKDEATTAITCRGLITDPLTAKF